MSGDSLRTTCCPDLWDRINELEAENQRLKEAARAVMRNATARGWTLSGVYVDLQKALEESD